MTVEPLTLRPLRAQDQPEWARLWRGYLAFYGTTLDAAQFELTFSRLLDSDPMAPSALVLSHPDPAGTDDAAPALAGLVHYLFHPHCWKPTPICYLQDLFVDPEQRGQGRGQRLIEAVYAAADKAEASGVYWMTQQDNATARRLYDRIGVATDFMKYQRG